MFFTGFGTGAASRASGRQTRTQAQKEVVEETAHGLLAAGRVEPCALRKVQPALVFAVHQPPNVGLLGALPQ